MYRPVENGGRAVPEIEGKLKAMFLTPILRACLSNDEGPVWWHFAKFWVGHKVLTSWGKRPTLKRPHADTCPSIYCMVLKSKVLGLTVIPHDKITRPKIEKCLSPQLQKLTPVGTLTEEKSKKVWSNVNSKFLTNLHKDLARQTVHECLPTKAFLERRHCSRVSVCPRLTCRADETVAHVFWQCPFAKRVWTLVSPWLQDLFRAPQKYEDIA